MTNKKSQIEQRARQAIIEGRARVVDAEGKPIDRYYLGFATYPIQLYNKLKKKYRDYDWLGIEDFYDLKEMILRHGYYSYDKEQEYPHRIFIDNPPVGIAWKE